MTTAILHASEPHLPMTLDTAGLALGIGLAVVLIVAYDYYRTDWSGGV